MTWGHSACLSTRTTVYQYMIQEQFLDCDFTISILEIENIFKKVNMTPLTLRLRHWFFYFYLIQL